MLTSALGSVSVSMLVPLAAFVLVAALTRACDRVRFVRDSPSSGGTTDVDGADDTDSGVSVLVRRARNRLRFG
ncbi:hypothetical protein ACFO0N_02235 [Halobium salinum]|uniref:Secreted protein n=1 Tax=Halobium salinum TaxID=1364940 RepID=A0ABD5P7F5_9EURY|nr:hypothetical protein [Halobium salinum]